MQRQLALVTGASSGIGFWLAKELANRGYDLVICSESDRLAAAAEEIRAGGTTVTAINADLATSQGVEDLWAKTEQSGLSPSPVSTPASVSEAFSARQISRPSST